MRDKIVFFGTVYLVSIYAAYSVGVEQTEDKHQANIKFSANSLYTKPIPEFTPTYIPVERTSPKVKCTYPKIVTSITPCQQWNRIASK